MTSDPLGMRRRDVVVGGTLLAASSLLPTSSQGQTTPVASLADLTATEAVRQMASGALKSEAYAQALLDRIKAEKRLNAFITLDENAVLTAARAADRLRASGKTGGRLHGLPIAVKDSVDTADYATSNGTQALRHFQPKANAPLLQRMLDEGAIVLGKTNMTELSFGWTSNNGAFGPVHNSYGFDRVPGGSSGGSAAAVASRMAPLAIGADTLGSIRVPAAMCGIAGLRPTFDRYPRDRIASLTTDKFDQAGPLARTVVDLALFDTVAAADAAPLAAASLRGVRIGVAPFYMDGLDPEIERSTRAALARLKEAGAVLVEKDVPDAVKSAFDVAAAIMLYETQPSITRMLADENTGMSFDQLFAQVSPGMQGFFKAVALSPNRPPKEAYEAMLAKRKEVQAALRQYYADQRIAVLAFPAICALAPPIGEEENADVGGKKVSFFQVFGRNTALSPVASTASLALPIGRAVSGLPMSLEVNALPGEDRKLLALGHAMEKVLGVLPAPAA